jgi:hypothetical protein
MTELAPVVFLLDVDNTLLDNDRLPLCPAGSTRTASKPT